MSCRPMVRTSSMVRSPTTSRITASPASRRVHSGWRTWKRNSLGSSIRYWTIHSMRAMLRSPVTMVRSASASSGYWLEFPAPGVLKPNSSFSWRWTATTSMTSMPSGSLKRRPGWTTSMKRPKRVRTPTESAGMLVKPVRMNQSPKTRRATRRAPRTKLAGIW